MQPEQLMTKLRALLSAELGYYQLANGVKTPAIALLGGNNNAFYKDRAVYGLECVIRRVPSGVGAGRIYGAVQRDKLWQCYLIQHQLATGQTPKLTTAIDKLGISFIGCKVFSVGTGDNLTATDQVSVRIPDFVEWEDAESSPVLN